MPSPVVYFEIPVIDLDRAMRLYTGVFGFRFQREVIDCNEMAPFPAAEGGSGITGSENGYVAELQDSEGNRVALSSPR